MGGLAAGRPCLPVVTKLKVLAAYRHYGGRGCSAPRAWRGKGLDKIFPGPGQGARQSLRPLEPPALLQRTKTGIGSLRRNILFRKSAGRTSMSAPRCLLSRAAITATSIVFKRTGLRPFLSLETSCFESRKGGRPVRPKNLVVVTEYTACKKLAKTWPTSGHGTPTCPK